MCARSLPKWNNGKKQESIPVACVPPACWPGEYCCPAGVLWCHFLLWTTTPHPTGQHHLTPFTAPPPSQHHPLHSTPLHGTPAPCEQNDTICKNITLPQTLFVGSNKTLTGRIQICTLPATALLTVGVAGDCFWKRLLLLLEPGR